MGHRAQAGGEAAGERLGGAAELVDHALHARAGEERHCACAVGDTSVLGECLPRRRRLRLGEAERVLAGVAEGGAVDLPGAPASDVADDELQRPADRGVGTVALT